jgi:hypothetical protein
MAIPFENSLNNKYLTTKMIQRGRQIIGKVRLDAKYSLYCIVHNTKEVHIEPRLARFANRTNKRLSKKQDFGKLTGLEPQER